MMRNDYRRALILLRSNAAGYSGHVRLERRTLMGSMYFLVQAGGDCPSLRAALVGKNRSGYYACSLGELQGDSRGQAVLGYSFDPRNICGKELEQYQLIIVASGDSPCRILLYGNVCGHADLDWNEVRAAVCALEGFGEPVEARELPVAEELPEPEAGLPEPVEEKFIEEIVEPEALEPEEAPAQQEGMDDPEPAAGQLDADLSLPWPDSIEPLRALYQSQPRLVDAPEDGLVYIAAPLPEDAGYAHCASAVRCENGAPVAVRYALPSAWSAEPPAGLEEYAWVGDSNRGWWVIEVSL